LHVYENYNSSHILFIGIGIYELLVKLFW